MINKYTPQEIQYLKQNYTTKGNRELADNLGRTADSIKCRLKRLGLKRTEKQVHALRIKPNTGQFLKGQTPLNTKYNGHERITKDGYVMVRIKKGKYVLKHLRLWEQKNGKLPENHCLWCIDGNKLNTDPSNWKLITRSENMYRNSKHDYPEQVIPSLVLISKVKNKLKTIQNGKK